MIDPRSRRATLVIPALLAGLSMLGPFSTDTPLPAFASMRAEFGVGSDRLQLIISAYLFAFGAMAIFHGPLSDALGRKPVMVGGGRGIRSCLGGRGDRADTDGAADLPGSPGPLRRRGCHRQPDGYSRPVYRSASAAVDEPRGDDLRDRSGRGPPRGRGTAAGLVVAIDLLDPGGAGRDSHHRGPPRPPRDPSAGAADPARGAVRGPQCGRGVRRCRIRADGLGRWPDAGVLVRLCRRGGHCRRRPTRPGRTRLLDALRAARPGDDRGLMGERTRRRSRRRSGAGQRRVRRRPRRGARQRRLGGARRPRPQPSGMPSLAPP
jgi:hypothetical protein